VRRAINVAPIRRATRIRRRAVARDGEHADQAALMRWAVFARARLPELALLYAIPNGGHRHKATAARLKAEGVKRGVPDVCLPVARSGAHGLYIELKTERGRPTPEQLGWIRALRRQGYAASVCRGWEQARLTIEDYLVGRNAVPAAMEVPMHGGNSEQAG
jgi:VRR-NUC domain